MPLSILLCLLPPQRSAKAYASTCGAKSRTNSTSWKRASPSLNAGGGRDRRGTPREAGAGRRADPGSGIFVSLGTDERSRLYSWVVSQCSFIGYLGQLIDHFKRKLGVRR